MYGVFEKAKRGDEMMDDLISRQAAKENSDDRKRTESRIGILR